MTEGHSSPGRRDLVKAVALVASHRNESTSKQAVSVSNVSRVILVYWFCGSVHGLPVLR